MLAAHPGSFFCYVPKTPTLLGTLLGARAATEQAVNERLDRYVEATARRSQAQPVSTTPETQVQKFVYPGGKMVIPSRGTFDAHSILQCWLQVASQFNLALCP
ncbi:hypothetical protein Vretimale_585 [Volvox reticuliferus]|uniref:Uncharacterized protein n=1 Tax=Volvox reticuliferus TaxID=1737510 RepID=A0A8J4FYK0_9CHLO|nr:hypothetical protein Vretimale_585 [Volvox reticuliferus]